MKDKKVEEKNELNEKIDIKAINVIIRLLKNMLKIGYVLGIILGIYVLIVLGKETGFFESIVKLLKVISPLFIGLVIAWLFNPIVKWFEKKKVKRIFGTTIVYTIFIALLALILSTLIPTLYKQILDFVGIVPDIFSKIKDWINAIFNSLDNVSIIDVNSIKTTIFSRIEFVGSNIISTLPELIISVASSLFSGVGNIIIGLIIGFFLLVSFEDNNKLIEFLPAKVRTVTKDVLDEADGALKTFVVGAIIDCTFIFVITSIGLYFAGLKAPLLFGLFCGITNIIPYAGPYIGGIPAVIVGFSQGIPTGIISLIVIVVIQFLEGNLLQPVILSKTTKLHPVTIIIGLLIFGYLWGILGMVIATPLIAAIKAVVLYFNEKYDILSFK